MYTKKEIDQQQTIYDLLRGYSDIIHQSTHKLSGLTEWFKAFLTSDTFSKLDPELKAEAFENYEGLKFILRHVDDLQLERI